VTAVSWVVEPFLLQGGWSHLWIRLTAVQVAVAASAVLVVHALALLFVAVAASAVLVVHALALLFVVAA